MQLYMHLLQVVLLSISAGFVAATPCNEAVRVLAVGDSLTNGAVPSLQLNHPYTIALGKLLEAELHRPVDIKVAAANSAGILKDTPGADTTISALLEQQIAAAKRPYDIIILMAGINDLGRGNQTADRVFVQLQSMISRASGAATTAVVVIAPWANRFVARSSDNETQRLRLLQMLLQRFEPARVAPGLPKLLLDRVAFDQFRFWEQPQDQRRQYQDDELHLTERGYDTLGGHVFDTLAKGGALAALKCGYGSPVTKSTQAGSQHPAAGRNMMLLSNTTASDNATLPSGPVLPASSAAAHTRIALAVLSVALFVLQSV